MECKEPITIEQPKKGGRPRKYATPEEAKEANRIKNIEGYYKKPAVKKIVKETMPLKKGRPCKYTTPEEAEEAKRQRSLQYYYKNKEKCIEKNKEYAQKQRDLLKSEKLKQEVTTN